MRTIPFVPLRDIVIFPGIWLPLFVSRKKSKASLKQAWQTDQKLILVTQKEAETQEPELKDLFAVGTLAELKECVELPDKTIKILAEAQQRVRLVTLVEHAEHFLVECEQIEDSEPVTPEFEALIQSAHAAFGEYVRADPLASRDVIAPVSAIKKPSRLADTLTAHLSLDMREKQDVFETVSSKQRLEKVLGLLRSKTPK
jgi:ATP-dependent Lon protease